MILVSGASGLIGNTVVDSLSADRVLKLTRNPSDDPHSIGWDVSERTIEAEKLTDVEAVIHLAGEPIMGRWTKKKRQRIRDSRVEGTRFLCETVSQLSPKPKLLICASAIGVYGCRDDEELTEDSDFGETFLADVGREWEAACEPAHEAGIRVVNMRLGMVLSYAGGALAKMRPIFKWCLGGRLGNGRQWWSWIALSDVIRGVHHIIENESISGPVNLVSPSPVTNREFTRTLAKALHRPAILPAPAFMIKLLAGRMAKELLLCSAKVFPARLQDTGFEFEHTELATAVEQP